MVMHRSTDEAFAPRCPRRRMVLVARYRIDVGDRRMDANAAEQGIPRIVADDALATRAEVGDRQCRRLQNIGERDSVAEDGGAVEERLQIGASAAHCYRCRIGQPAGAAC
jgi:hypothetical protein